ncbi:unnamed protein product, partial [marine sediment metagenome]
MPVDGMFERPYTVRAVKLMDGLSAMALPAVKLSRRLEDYLEAVLMLSREDGVA